MSALINLITRHNKAIVGFIGSGFVTWLALRSNGLTGDEWIQIILSALGGAGIVFLVPNMKKKNDSVQV